MCKGAASPVTRGGLAAGRQNRRRPHRARCTGVGRSPPGATRRLQETRGPQAAAADARRRAGSDPHTRAGVALGRVPERGPPSDLPAPGAERRWDDGGAPLAGDCLVCV